MTGAPHALLLEAGDSLVDNDARRKGTLRDQTVKKAEVVADFFKAVPPDAVSIGETDFTLGFDRSLEMLEARGFHAVTTNLRRKGETAPGYKVTEVAGYRFLSLTLFGKKAAPEGLEWTDPVESMDAARKAAGAVDVTLVTFHLIDEATARRIAERGDFVKVLIDADSSRRLKPTSRTTRTLVVAPPLKGTELLILDLFLKRGAEAWYQAKRFEVVLKGGGTGEGLGTREEEGAAARECHLSRTEGWRLDGAYKDDAEVAKLMAAYRQWTKTKGLDAAREAAAVAGATPYTGAEACAACHEAQHANWKTTRHSHAWTSLEKDPDGGAEDPECISCHVSGFLQPGGPARIEELAKFRGVQCESCHLPVKDHPGGKKFAKVSEEQCRTCHSETRDPDFDFKTYLKPATCVTPKTPADDRPHR